MRTLPELELSEEQIAELVSQLPPAGKRRLMQLLDRMLNQEAEPYATARMSSEEFARLSCFGMWADHDAMLDSVAWVRKERQQWHSRVSPRD
ncbi:MAG: hypothetical protein WHS44_05990 [Fimbriimonadales bacterium]